MAMLRLVGVLAKKGKRNIPQEKGLGKFNAAFSDGPLADRIGAESYPTGASGLHFGWSRPAPVPGTKIKQPPDGGVGSPFRMEPARPRAGDRDFLDDGIGYPFHYSHV